MLEEWKFDRKKLDEAECKVRLKARRLDLAGLQQPIKGHKAAKRHYPEE